MMSKANIESRTIDELHQGGRILVSRLQYLGDVILTLPMVRLLHERFPRAEIDYLARGPGAEVLRGERMLSRVFRLPDKDEGWRATWRLIRGLRKRGYALAIDLYSNPRSAIMTRLSGARMRIGGARRVRRHLYTHPIAVADTIRAATAFHIEHLRPLGVMGDTSKPCITLTRAERDWALSFLEQVGVREGTPTVGLHPGGKWEVKRWPAAYFGSLAKRLADDFRVQIVVLCGPGEERHRDEVRVLAGDRALYLPTLSIRETAAVLDRLQGVVVNDGGVMHLAVAVGTPTVGVFGSAEPDIWFPYGEFGPYTAAHVPIACRPCHSHVCDHLSCLRTLTVDWVERDLFRVMTPKKDSLGSAEPRAAT